MFVFLNWQYVVKRSISSLSFMRVVYIKVFILEDWGVSLGFVSCLWSSLPLVLGELHSLLRQTSPGSPLRSVATAARYLYYPHRRLPGKIYTIAYHQFRWNFKFKSYFLQYQSINSVWYGCLKSTKIYALYPAFL